MKKSIITLTCLTIGAAAFAQSHLTPIAVTEKPGERDYTVQNISYETLSSENLADGRLNEILKLSDGKILRITRQKSATQGQIISAIQKGALSTSDANVTFFESFEGWDGENYDWHPDGWQDISKEGNVAQLEYGVNVTWYCSPSAFGKAPDGKYIMWVNLSYEKDVETPDGIVHIPKVRQDEWLITPEIIPTSTSRLAFDIYYCPTYVIPSESNPYDADMELLASEDNGETWEKIWSASETAIKEEEENPSGGSMVLAGSWYNYSIDVSKFANKKMKFAFRYVGNGDSMGIDAVTFRDPIPEAAYDAPLGTFHWSFNDELMYLNNITDCLLAPAYTPLQWRNTSNDETYSYEWTFFDKNNNEQTETDEEPVVSFPPSATTLPTLTGYSNVGDFSSVYSIDDSGNSFIQYGGTTAVNAGGEILKLSAGNNIPSKGVAVGPVGDNAFIFGVGSDASWGTWKLNGVGNLFEKPYSPYLINSIWALCVNVSPKTDTELELTVYRSENGSPKEAIATAVCKSSDFKLRQSDPTNNIYLYSIPFVFEKPLEIKDEIIVSIRNFNNGNFNSIGFCYQYNNHDFNKNYGYVHLLQAQDPNGSEYVFSLPGMFKDLNTSFFINMDITYPYLSVVSPNNRFEVPATGAKQTFTIDSYYPAENLTFNNLPSWIKRSELTQNAEGKYLLDIEVEELPADKDKRTYQLNISATGSSTSITIVQSKDFSGVTNTETSADINLVSSNNAEWEFNVNPESYTRYELFDISGRLMDSGNISDTRLAVEKAGLSNGVYIIRFTGQGNTQIKLMK